MAAPEKPTSRDPFHQNSMNSLSNVFTIESVQFPNVYLRMDGRGVTGFSGSGAGTVDCQFTAGPYERFNLQEVPNQENVFAIQSAQFPDVYLRMDGSGVTGFTGSGAGIVNCQFTAGPYELFLLQEDPNTPDVFTIQSVQFPGVYLRMDGSGVTTVGEGAGIVNCQFTAGPYEKFTFTRSPR